MKLNATQNLLSAQHSKRRVTIGLDPPEELRHLSDTRALTCPGCGAVLVLHAGTVRAHHFAHLPGAVCSLPAPEPETEEHRAGKLLLARWLRARLPEAEVVVEAYLPSTRQRADVMVSLPQVGDAPRRIVLEFQCAQLSAHEWRRRHRLYREAGIADLWLLGGSRLHSAPVGQRERGVPADEYREASSERRVTLRTSELERALLWDGAPLLFLDAEGVQLKAEMLARFRPDAEAQALRPEGRLVVRALYALDFPMALLDWPANADPHAPPAETVRRAPGPQREGTPVSVERLWEWLAQRYRVTSETLPAFFGMPVFASEVFACEARLWQAAIYYRFLHRRVGDRWWLTEVETWARAYLPLTRPVSLKKLRGALESYQELLAAAGMLSLPMGYGRVNARVQDDLTTLSPPPDREETLRLARYRRTLTREECAEYTAATGE